jgi:putative Mn2+ efflux pump MntP
LAPGVATKVIAASCALTAFSVGIMAGLFAGNPTDTILVRSLVAMAIGQVIGMVVGSIGERTVAEGIRAYEGKRLASEAKIDSSGSGLVKLSA